MKKITIILLSILSIALCNGQSKDNIIMEIQNEFSLINNLQNLSKDSIDILGESTEGGYACNYKDYDGRTRKIIAVFYGETAKVIEEYYLKNENLIFALIQRYDYNKPIYYNDKIATESKDSIVFDSNKTNVLENRYYFDKFENLIQWIDNNRTIIRDNKKLRRIVVEILEKYRYLSNLKK